MNYVAPIPKSVDLRKGNHLVRFSWNTGPAARPGVSLHDFPDIEKDAICIKGRNMTRMAARLEWQNLLNSGFYIDRA